MFVGNMYFKFKTSYVIKELVTSLAVLVFTFMLSFNHFTIHLLDFTSEIYFVLLMGIYLGKTLTTSKHQSKTRQQCRILPTSS